MLRFNPLAERPRLNDLELELLELCATSAETTTTLHEEMLEVKHERALVESTLRGLARRGLLTMRRGIYAGVQRSRTDPSEGVYREYLDDWWDVTAEGREALRHP